MSVSIPTKGTCISDGVRTGPILNSQYTAAVNPQSNAALVQSPNDTQPPGIYNTPLSMHDVIPVAVSTTALAGSQTPGSAGYLTLVSTSAAGITIKTNFGGVTGPSSASVIQLDTPRNITITSGGDDHLINVTVFGWDLYGFPMAEQITLTNTSTAVGKKAFYIVQAIYISAASASTITAGIGNVFGLPYFCPSANYYFQPMWNNLPEFLTTVLVPQTAVSLGNNPLTTDGSTAAVVVAVASTAGLLVGDRVVISGATATGGISAVNLNIESSITAIVTNTSFTYTAAANSASPTSGGGAAVKYTLDEPSNSSTGTITVADQHTATATTGDVRGTYTPSSNADGIKRLTINFYAPSADYRRYNNASNSASVILANNPLSATSSSAVITVTAPNHQLTTGELVTISGATTFASISVGNLNLSNTAVTVVDENHFTYVAGGTAGSTTTGGGSAVTLSPSVGNLYQIPVGRFGVTQYNIALF